MLYCMTMTTMIIKVYIYIHDYINILCTMRYITLESMCVNPLDRHVGLDYYLSVTRTDLSFAFKSTQRS